LGYNKYWRWFCLEPFAMFDWVSSWQHGFHEHGANAFGFKRQYSGLLRSELGFRFFEVVQRDSFSLIIQEKASYANEKPFHLGAATLFLVGGPGSFTVGAL